MNMIPEVTMRNMTPEELDKIIYFSDLPEMRAVKNIMSVHQDEFYPELIDENSNMQEELEILREYCRKMYSLFTVQPEGINPSLFK